MIQVDFIYDDDCPNVAAARANLMRAFSLTGVGARWEEHRIGSEQAPERVRGYGSPSILVNGGDVAGVSAGAEVCCRIYDRSGVPEVELIAQALERAQSSDVVAPVASTPPAVGATHGRWRSTAGVLPGIGAALLPKVICPLCWPAYAGVLGATGLTFLMEDRWLLPISVLFLVGALIALGWKARARRGYGPLTLGALSSLGIVLGKFTLDSTTAVNIAVAALVLACVWNVWPRKKQEPSCSACCVAETP